ncbi:MAG: regulatory protein RecX [Candidatus Zixiibacteriota bacterium]
MSDPIRILQIRQFGVRYWLTISGLEKPIAVGEELVQRYRLKEGIVVTEPQLAQLLAEAELAECDRETARLLAMRDHSIGELKLKLVRKQFSRKSIQEIIKRYESRGLLDDSHYAHNLARRALEKNPSGRTFLVATLVKKHVNRQLAEETADMVLAGTDEVTLAVASLRKRWRTLRQLELETARTRAYTYLGRRGISYEAARAAFEQLYDQENEVEDY